jgi:cytochrome c biogenesis protein CcmG, thiol:disulfide interchange protein DsbE
MPPARSNTNFGDLGWARFTSETTRDDQSAPRVRLADYQGSVLVLDFYATWCAPCRHSVPHLVSLQRRYRQNGLKIVGLNVGGPEDRPLVAGFAKEFAINYELGFPEDTLAEFLLSDDASIPQTFVLSRAGRPVQRFVGYNEETGIMMEQVIQSELAK